MGDHHDGLIEAVDRAAQDVEHAGARGRVEVARRLVGEDDGGASGERAGDRDALLLAAGELGRAGASRGRRGRPSRAARSSQAGIDLAAGDPDRQRDVLGRVEHRHEVEELEDEAELRAAQLRHPLVGEAGDLGAVDPDVAAGGLVEAGEQVHQRRLAGAGRADDRGQLTAREVEVDAAQRVDRSLALAEAAREPTAGDDRVALLDCRCGGCGFHRAGTLATAYKPAMRGGKMPPCISPESRRSPSRPRPSASAPRASVRHSSTRPERSRSAPLRSVPAPIGALAIGRLAIGMRRRIKRLRIDELDVGTLDRRTGRAAARRRVQPGPRSDGHLEAQPHRPRRLLARGRASPSTAACSAHSAGTTTTRSRASGARRSTTSPSPAPASPRSACGRSSPTPTPLPTTATRSASTTSASTCPPARPSTSGPSGSRSQEHGEVLSGPGRPRLHARLLRHLPRRPRRDQDRTPAQARVTGTARSGSVGSVKLLAFSDLHRDLEQAARLTELSDEAES